MLTVMKETFGASIVATAGWNKLFSVLWLRCLSVQAFIPVDVGTLVTLKRSMIQYGR